MNDRAASLFHVSYRMERGDYVALTVALGRREPRRILFELTCYVLLLALVALGVAGSLDNLLAALEQVVTLPGALVYVPLLVAGPIILLLTPQIGGLIAALIYRRNAIADKQVTLDLTVEGIEGGATDLYSRIGWAAVRKLVETPTHLFIQISKREALIIPRRAIADEDVYRNILGFIRARTGLSTR